MPNTLAHLGLQALVSARLTGSDRLTDLRWVALGCVIPDVPWIVRRIVTGVAPELGWLDARAYAIGQSSLLVSLLLAGAIACMARSPRRAFGLMAANVALHLFVDSLQTKWGNGVLLFAPFDFEPVNLGLFWPESAVSYSFAVAGGFVAVLAFRGPSRPALELFAWRRGRAGAAAALLAAYVIVPACWIDGVIEADAHGVRTLSTLVGRAGVALSLDRVGVERRADGGLEIIGPGGQRFECVGDCPGADGRYSLAGRFESDSRFEVVAHHAHSGRIRDGLSYVGLLAIAGIWLRGAWRPTGVGATRPDARGGQGE